MTNSERLDFSYLRQVHAAISALVEQGWTVVDQGRFIRLSGPIEGSPTDWPGIGDLERFVTFAEASGERRGDAITLQKVNGLWEFFSFPNVQPDQWFSSANDVKFARQAWEHQTSALTYLELKWRVDFTLDLDQVSRKDLEVWIKWYPSSIDDMFLNSPGSDIGNLIPAVGRRIYLALDGDRAELEFGAITFASLNQLKGLTLSLTTVPETLAGEPDVQPPVSTLLYLSGDRTSWPEISQALIAAACTSIWMALSSSHTKSTVQFSGYKRVEFDLPGVWLPSAAEGALRVREWAFSQRSADRLLAIRQIISLYSESPFDYVDEILASADPIYFALRSDATAEALRDTRDAETHAQQAVRFSSQGAVDLAKLAGERVLAGLIAAGVASIANVTKVLEAEVTTTILGFIAGYFALIFTLFLLIDRLAIGLPIRQLEAELQRKVTYLSPTAIRSISESPTVRGARRLVTVTRVAVAAVYGGILIALAVVIAVRLA